MLVCWSHSRMATSYQSILARIANENFLYTALLELTYRCNLDCFFCYNDREPHGQPLTLTDYFRVLDELRALGTLNLVLSGGEPLAYPDLFALGRRARELGFVVRLKSNGHALREVLARRVRAELDPYEIELSLHGACAATHDRQTRAPGSFDRLIGNLRVLLELGLRIRLNATLTAWNEGEIAEMFRLADGLGIVLRVDPSVTPRDNGDCGPLQIAPSREGLARLYVLQQERAAGVTAGKSTSGGPDEEAQPPVVNKHCGAGSNSVAIDPYGNVYPCVQWRIPAGNLHRNSMKEIWGGSAVLDQVRTQTVAARAMLERHGSAARQAGFCPGLAHQASGIPIRLDPATRRRLTVLRRLQYHRRWAL